MIREDRLVSTAQACSLLSVSRVTFVKMRKENNLLSFSKGRNLFFDKCEIALKIIQTRPVQKAPKRILS